ncbi:MAG: serine hydrolase [Robiginitomaculum sp.]|nr:MAG: serine hydrolase [Robiginitomaculum sp.]
MPVFNRRTLLASGAGLCFTLAACHMKTVSVASSLSFDRDIALLFKEEMEGVNVPGMAIGLAKNGIIRHVQGFGYANIEHQTPVTVNSMFALASVTKTVTALAVMQLVDANLIHLDDAVAPHLDFALINPHHPDKEITFRQLLQHTSSISDKKAYEVDLRTHGGDTTMSLETLVKSYLVVGGKLYDGKKCFTREHPGTIWAYSNVGYALLGYLVQRITKKEFSKSTRDTIFKPLGLAHMCWTIAEVPKDSRVTPYDYSDDKYVAEKPVGFPDAPAGMLRGSVEDILKFTSACANEGKHDGARILSKKSCEMMMVMEDIHGIPPYLTGQGLAWSAAVIKETAIPSHWGGDPGVYTAAYADPIRKTAVVVLMNRSATAQSRDILRGIVTKLFDLSDEMGI